MSALVRESAHIAGKALDLGQCPGSRDFGDFATELSSTHFLMIPSVSSRTREGTV